MLNLRLSLAILSAKTIRKIILLRKKSGAMAAPGLFALKIDPNLIPKLCRNFKNGVILISGTNGKTTTSRMISTILKTAGYLSVHNRTGSNLIRGIASILSENASISGKFKADFGIFETDEAILPQAILATSPKFVLLTNLFRDQLDRYGEIDKIKKIWLEALLELNKNTTVLLNTDDPSIAHLGHKLTSKVIYYGIEDIQIGEKELSRFADAKYCGFCASPLDYEVVYLSHLGKFACKNCKNKRPQPQISASRINIAGIDKAGFKLNVFNSRSSQILINLPGLYNVYNALAASALTCALGIDQANIKQGLADFKAAFGRVEKFEIDNREVWMFLIKNPTGFNEVIRTIFAGEEKVNLLISINDKIADGKDVSWLWDVDFEKFTGKLKSLVVSGDRSYDMALRLKYANVIFNDIQNDFDKSIQSALEKTANGQRLFILPTYTSMLEIRRALEKMGLVHHFAQD